MSALEQSIKLHEGFMGKPYRCTAGRLTIGFGRNLDDRGITQEEAEYLLRNDIAIARKELDERATGWKRLSPARQDVLVELVYNMGMPRLSTFMRFWEAMRDQDYDKAAAELLDSKWAKQVGQRAKTLAEKMRKG